jgi:hypothetical protein
MHQDGGSLPDPFSKDHYPAVQEYQVDAFFSVAFFR